MAKQKSILLTVVLMGASAILIFYIISMTSSIFNSAKESMFGQYSASACMRMSTDVKEESISYTGRRLEFSVENTGTAAISYISVFSDKVREPQRRINTSIFYTRQNKDIVIEDFLVNTSFFVFPEGCSQNVQEVALNTAK